MASTDALTFTAVKDILGLGSAAAEQRAQATASGFAAQGDAAEQDAYTKAQLIAGQNAALEATAGQLQGYQEERAAQKTIGSERAAIAASGFTEGGSALAGIQSSTRQAALTQQLIATQTGLNEGGFVAQGAAAQGEAAAAGFANNAATALASASSSAAASSAATQAAETKALLGYLASTNQIGGTPNSPNPGQPLTPGGNTAVSVLSSAGVQGVPTSLPTPTWTQGPNGQWTYGQPQGAAPTSPTQIGEVPGSPMPLGNALGGNSPLQGIPH